MMFNIGDQQFTSRDCQNHLRDINVVVLNYCKKQQAKNPNFFHAIQCDDIGYMVNFFLGGCAIKDSLSLLWRCCDI